MNTPNRSVFTSLITQIQNCSWLDISASSCLAASTEKKPSSPSFTFLMETARKSRMCPPPFPPWNYQLVTPCSHRKTQNYSDLTPRGKSFSLAPELTSGLLQTSVASSQFPVQLMCPSCAAQTNWSQLSPAGSGGAKAICLWHCSITQLLHPAGKMTGNVSLEL